MIEYQPGFEYLQEPEFIQELYPSMVPEEIPSETDKAFGFLKEGFRTRRNYTKDVMFPLLSLEMLQDLRVKLDAKGIKTFVELYSGTGALILLLNNLGYQGKGYTLDPGMGDHNPYGFDPNNRFTKEALEKDLLVFKDIQELVLDEKPDMMVASWIPYGHGEELIEFVRVNPETTPEYFLLMGEGEGGCTANDEFFVWLHENYELEETIHYRPFISIYDSVELYRRKS